MRNVAVVADTVNAVAMGTQIVSYVVLMMCIYVVDTVDIVVEASVLVYSLGIDNIDSCCYLYFVVVYRNTNYLTHNIFVVDVVDSVDAAFADAVAVDNDFHG